MKRLVLSSAILLVIPCVVSAIPNPAAVYCVEQGYRYEIRTDDEGNQYGVCISPDGTECMGWEYYRKCMLDGEGCETSDCNCNLPCKELPCKKAGEGVLVSECCEGLIQIFPTYIYDANCNFTGIVGWIPICSDCGNGICESWESKCNCPQDCNCLDIDYDGVNDCADNCPDDYNPYQADNDTDGIGDECDPTPDKYCPSTFAECTTDNDCHTTGCGGEICASISEEIFSPCLWETCTSETIKCGCFEGKCQWGVIDADDDRIPDAEDNCPYDYNPNQIDSDGDGTGNACDEDCPNLDGINPVGLVDFSILAYNWQVNQSNLLGDLNFDDVVDVNDLAVFALYWLSECYEE